ncbi:hypothetical protein QC763_409390 [Podospora pseudopauciseta]|uniref:SET domain-containing protein n=1 Tax=Podospora pseudopauciseta TaxID=2093780 RepID=A0ABR0HD58_9PEZI|nr:hypothetical protein QC763_409390 [Podospora pseudopauciseta]
MSETRKRKHPANESSIKRTKSSKMPKETPPSKPPSQPTPSQPTLSTTPSNDGPFPVNWPKSLPFLTTPAYSPQITPSQLSLLRTLDPDLPTIPGSFPLGPAPHVKITPITDPKHPAHGQSGLFATQHLPPDTLILPYLGHYHPGSGPGLQDEDYDYTKSDYDLWLDRDADVAVDAARAGNEARFVNDYRGIPFTPPEPVPGQKKPPKQQKGKPNAEFKVAWDERTGQKVMSVWVLPRGKKGLNTGIERGEEVMVSYGRGFWEGRKQEGEGEN